MSVPDHGAAAHPAVSAAGPALPVVGAFAALSPLLPMALHLRPDGRIAGAGVAGHLHQHIVPRWALDSNFFPIIAKTKALPQLLGEVRAEIQAAWPSGPAR